MVLQDLTVAAALRQKGVTTAAMLEGDVHGRGGLKRCLLQKAGRLSDTSGTPLVRLHAPSLMHVALCRQPKESVCAPEFWDLDRL